jgi:hypothetical protein
MTYPVEKAFDSRRLHQHQAGPSLRSGFRLRARTPAERLKFDSRPSKSTTFSTEKIGQIHSGAEGLIFIRAAGFAKEVGSLNL